MFKFVAFVVLLSAALKLGQSARTKETGVTELNNYVLGCFEESYLLEDKFADIQSTLRYGNLSKPNLGQAAKQLADRLLKLKQISHVESCGQQNLKNLLDVLFSFHSQDNDSFKRAKRKLSLNQFVIDYVEAAVGKCLKEFEQDFRSDEETWDMQALYGFRFGYKEEEPSEAGSISVAKVFDENKIRAMIEVMNERSIRTGNYKIRANLEEAKIYLQTYLFDPCKQFRDENKYKKYENLFEKISTLSQAALLAKYYPVFRWKKYSLQAASAAAACRSLKDGDLEKFAEKLSK